MKVKNNSENRQSNKIFKNCYAKLILKGKQKQIFGGRSIAYLSVRINGWINSTKPTSLNMYYTYFIHPRQIEVPP